MQVDICPCCGKPRKPRQTGGHMGYSRGSGDLDNQNEFGTTVPHTVNKAAHIKTDFVTDSANTWQGHRYGGQALKPAFEFICVAQVPYAGRPVDSITATGAGALWIDGGRIGTDEGDPNRRFNPTENEAQNNFGGGIDRRDPRQHGTPAGRWPSNLLLVHSEQCRQVGTRRVKGITGGKQTSNGYHGGITAGARHADADGRETVAAWDCAPECPVAALGRQSGERPGAVSNGSKTPNGMLGTSTFAIHDREQRPGHNDQGTAARFFFQADYMAERLEAADAVIYEAKSSRAEREAGLDPRQVKLLGMMEVEGGDPTDARYHHRTRQCNICGTKANNGKGSTACGHDDWSWVEQEVFTESTINDGRQKSIDNPYQRGQTVRRNTHATIKPIALARHLATLLLPPAEYAPRRLLIPFAGAGSEMIGALLAGWDEIVGVELEQDHVRIAEARLAYWQQRRHEFGDPSKPITAQLSEAPHGQLDLFADYDDKEPFVAFDEWYAKTKDYGGTREEWERIYGGKEL